MKLPSLRVLNGLSCLLLGAAVAAACGSSDGNKSERAQGGEAGSGGEAGATAQGGDARSPSPSAGNGGEPTSAGGAGGAPLGEGGVAQGGVAQGGVAQGGAGGESGLPPLDCNPIVFANANLEEAVRDKINKPTGDLTPADVAELTLLDASGVGVSDLAGIECLSALQGASFGMGGATSSFSNLAPLVYLTELTTLDLSNND